MLKKVFSNEGKVKRANKKVKSALSLFAIAKKQVERANQALKEAIDADKKEITNLEANIKGATKEVEGNNKIIEKLNEFVPTK